MMCWYLLALGMICAAVCWLSLLSCHGYRTSRWPASAWMDATIASLCAALMVWCALLEWIA